MCVDRCTHNRRSAEFAHTCSPECIALARRLADLPMTKGLGKWMPLTVTERSGPEVTLPFLSSTQGSECAWAPLPLAATRHARRAVLVCRASGATRPAEVEHWA